MNQIPFCSRKSLVGRGDLVRALETGNVQLAHLIRQQLGLSVALKFEQKLDQGIAGDGVKPPPITPKKLAPPAGYPKNIQDISIWMVTHYEGIQSKTGETQPRVSPAYHWENRPLEQPIQPQIVPWRETGPKLRSGLVELRSSNLIDVDKLVKKIASGIQIEQIPRLPNKRWGSLQIIKDVSFRLAPIQFDQDQVIERLQRLLPPNSIEVFRGPAPDGLYWCDQLNEYEKTGGRQYREPRRSAQILILGDLGGFDSQPQLGIDWFHWCSELRNEGHRIFGLYPGDCRSGPPYLNRAAQLINWQHSSLAIRDRKLRRELVYEMLVLASPAILVQPGMLREIRQLIPRAVDASLEIDFWNSDYLSSNHPVAATINRDRANKELRPKFEGRDDVLKESVLEIIKRWRSKSAVSPEVWFDELLSLSDESRELVPGNETDLHDARACIEYFRQQIESDRTDPDRKDAIAAFIARLTGRLSVHALEDEQIGQTLTELRRRFHPQASLADGESPSDIPPRIPPREIKDYQLKVHGDSIAMEPQSSNQSGIAIGHLSSANGVFRVWDRAVTTEAKFWKLGKQPPGVSDFGTDEFGAWFEFIVDKREKSTPATVRMRWIRPGEFLMGSPKDEKDRWDNESPQHRVVLTTGFWIAETPCTQRLWELVMGTRPSRFAGPERPVEQVSWNDAQEFLKHLNRELARWEFRLPSEAEWEYACRAGTTTPYSFGAEADPELANFNRNLYSTTDVRSYPPNPWGLYDMHGNVWESCQDRYGLYADEEKNDPRGPDSGTGRVLRGGSWFRLARFARSAARSRIEPSVRDRNIGFRCLSSASIAEPNEVATVPVAEQGRETPRLGGAGKFGRSREIRLTPKASKQPLGLVSGDRIQLESDQATLELQRVSKPPWAIAFGTDLFGTFADFELATSENVRDQLQKTYAEIPPEERLPAPTFETVKQRLRWINPGDFQMGSPVDEPGRRDDEALHPVRISTGFWMFDTPCTQALWMAVMETNPSYFPDPCRPVETVNWDEANAFSERLAARLGIEMRLPTEAEWEYACRGGTQEMTYAGPITIISKANAPELDQIAWYGGNAGHQYDHPKSLDVSDFDWLKDKPYGFDRSGTRKVKQKLPNPRGLFDMLGNVWEWCLDWYAEDTYSETETEMPQIDPTGPLQGSERVLRGGAWFSFASVLRSAARYKIRPDDQIIDIGFRCLSSASQSSRVVERVSAAEEKPRDEAPTKQRNAE